MQTVGDIYAAIDRAAPFASAMDFDNAGLLVGSRTQPVHRVLLALDITPSVVCEAVEKGVQLIVSHHPVIFHPLRRVEEGSPVYLLAQAGLAAICAHTNLDLADGIGVNDALAKKLGLENIRKLPGDESGLLRMGELPVPRDGGEFLRDIKQFLSCGSVQATAVPETVQRMAVCGGAGGDFALVAKEAGADLYLTGEAKHNELLEAAAVEMPMAVCGHHATEFPVLAVLQAYLQKAFPQMAFLLTRHTREPYTVI